MLFFHHIFEELKRKNIFHRACIEEETQVRYVVRSYTNHTVHVWVNFLKKVNNISLIICLGSIFLFLLLRKNTRRTSLVFSLLFLCFQFWKCNHVNLDSGFHFWLSNFTYFNMRLVNIRAYIFKIKNTRIRGENEAYTSSVLSLRKKKKDVLKPYYQRYIIFHFFRPLWYCISHVQICVQRSPFKKLSKKRIIFYKSIHQFWQIKTARALEYVFEKVNFYRLWNRENYGFTEHVFDISANGKWDSSSKASYPSYGIGLPFMYLNIQCYITFICIIKYEFTCHGVSLIYSYII